MNQTIDLLTESSSLVVDWSNSWLVRLSLNLVAYATVVVPAYALIVYIRRQYASQGAQNLVLWPTGDRRFVINERIVRLLILFAIGRPTAAAVDLESGGDEKQKLIDSGQQKKSAPATLCSIRFVICFIGLQANYVIWGWLQEMLMTQPYRRHDSSNTFDRFGDSQFLVFLNRLFAFVLSAIYILCTWSSQPLHTPAFYQYSFASFANIMSSWCQYEALKYVSFITQTLCKSSKMIVVMLVGSVISSRRSRSTPQQYAVALCIVIGVSIFFISAIDIDDDQHHHRHPHHLNDSDNHYQPSIELSMQVLSGLLLMSGYLLFDAFTPNWQAALYAHRPRISSYQMMCGVNAFSAIFCAVSLFEQNQMISAIRFMFEHEYFMRDCLLGSIVGAVGQIFIYKTIESYGPIIFTFLMTIRQVLSILVSAIYYDHPISIMGIVGLVITFMSLFVFVHLKPASAKK